MRVNMRDLLILMDCAKFAMRFVNQNIGWSNEDITETYERVFNETKKIDFIVEEKNDSST